MGLPAGWVTAPSLGLTGNQKTTALGNGLLPLQASQAIHLAMRATTLALGAAIPVNRHHNQQS